MAKSFMAGDSLRDVEAGMNAGCTSVLLTDKAEANKHGVMCYKSLYEFYEAMR